MAQPSVSPSHHLIHGSKIIVPHTALHFKPPVTFTVRPALHKANHRCYHKGPGNMRHIKTLNHPRKNRQFEHISQSLYRVFLQQIIFNPIAGKTLGLAHSFRQGFG